MPEYICRACGDTTVTRAAGKGANVAQVAVMHKLLNILNAIVKHQRPWTQPA